MNYLPNYVYELVLAGQTIRIFSSEKKANEALEFYREHTMYVKEKENYSVRKAVVE